MRKIIAAFLSVIIALFPNLIAGSNSRRFAVLDYGELSNANASVNAKAVYSYICSTYKHKILTGQQESTYIAGPEYEMDYIKATTGKLPAIRGMDFILDDFDGVVQRAKDWWDKGGIVTICWHCGSDFSNGYQECLNSNIANWDAALTEGTPEYTALIAGMDKAAAALQELDDAGVPVLWRPFHEAGGDWFWWSRGGAQNLVKLWRIMYTRYTDYWKLDNLIWVYGYQAKPETPKLWYPGDGYVDIAGADSYYGGTQALLYDRIKFFIGNRKPICFHETGTIPKMDDLQKWGVDWSYFMTWHSEFLMEDKWNTKANLIEVYNSDYAITLDELPKFGS
ncbi:MAG: glycosyl hydrolase [Eubacteriales bacterium]